MCSFPWEAGGLRSDPTPHDWTAPPSPGECSGLVRPLERDADSHLAVAECPPDSGFQCHFVCVLFILLRFI